MRPRQHFDRLDRGGVPSDQAVVVPVGAHQIGQQFGICGVGLRARNVVAAR